MLGLQILLAVAAFPAVPPDTTTLHARMQAAALEAMIRAVETDFPSSGSAAVHLDRSSFEHGDDRLSTAEWALVTRSLGPRGQVTTARQALGCANDVPIGRCRFPERTAVVSLLSESRSGDSLMIALRYDRRDSHPEAAGRTLGEYRVIVVHRGGRIVVERVVLTVRS